MTVIKDFKKNIEEKTKNMKWSIREVLSPEEITKELQYIQQRKMKLKPKV